MNRELDAQLAETVFGYTRGKTPKDAHGEHDGDDILIPPGGYGGYQYPPLGKLHLAFHIPQWSASLEDAWALVCALNRVDIEVRIGSFPKGKYCVELSRWRDRGTLRSRETFVLETGEDLPEVICKAVLRSGLRLNL